VAADLSPLEWLLSIAPIAQQAARPDPAAAAGRLLRPLPPGRYVRDVWTVQYLWLREGYGKLI